MSDDNIYVLQPDAEILLNTPSGYIKLTEASPKLIDVGAALQRAARHHNAKQSEGALLNAQIKSSKGTDPLIYVHEDNPELGTLKRLLPSLRIGESREGGIDDWRGP